MVSHQYNIGLNPAVCVGGAGGGGCKNRHDPLMTIKMSVGVKNITVRYIFLGDINKIINFS